MLDNKSLPYGKFRCYLLAMLIGRTVGKFQTVGKSETLRFVVNSISLLTPKRLLEGFKSNVD